MKIRGIKRRILSGPMIKHRATRILIKIMAIAAITMELLFDSDPSNAPQLA